MKKDWYVWLFAVMFGALCAAAPQRGTESAQGDERYAGTWSGTSEGAGTGGFEMTLDTREKGSLGGRVSVTSEPTYKATLRTLAFAGAKMTAACEFPGDEGIEIALTAGFEGNSAKVAMGTWTATRK